MLICVVLILVIPRLSGLAASAVAPGLAPIDPDGAFMWMTVHHLVQLALTFLAAALYEFGARDLGFTMREREASLSYLRWFVYYFVMVALAGYVLLSLTSAPPVFYHPLTPRPVAGRLAFTALLSGTATEPLFRGLVMMVLFRSWRGASTRLGFRISHAGLIATALYVAAHVGFSVAPLQVTWFSPIQLAQAAVLGLFYAVVFDRTRSLLAPILAHNFANVFLTAADLLWAVSA